MSDTLGRALFGLENDAKRGPAIAVKAALLDAVHCDPFSSFELGESPIYKSLMGT